MQKKYVARLTNQERDEPRLGRRCRGALGHRPDPAPARPATQGGIGIDQRGQKSELTPIIPPGVRSARCEV
jgi:hypothetical protein